MNRSLLRPYCVELLGTFGLVFFAAGAVCVNFMTTPEGLEPASTLTGGAQPGLVGIALAQGLILALMLAITVPISGGYLNPAITVMLWVFSRMDSVKTAWFLGA